MKKLAFKDGYAIIVNSISEEASEYHEGESTYRVEVVFRTAVGIKRFAEEVGTNVMSKEEKKSLLDKKKNGATTVSFRCTLTGVQMPICAPLWYEKTGVRYSFENHYSDVRIDTTIPTTKDGLKNMLKNKDFKTYYKDYQVGSCADGNSFKSVVNAYIRSKNVISSR